MRMRVWNTSSPAKRNHSLGLCSALRIVSGPALHLHRVLLNQLSFYDKRENTVQYGYIQNRAGRTPRVLPFLDSF
jgi:hypothetical protein